MILLELFYTFLIIGLFTFGGGYSMIALIQDQVVVQHGWITPAEFADIVAISQVTPGPVGINTATYTGYAAVAAAGYPVPLAVAASLLASLAVLALPMAAILLVGRWLMAHRDNAVIATLMPILRLTVVGLIAAAALSLVSADTFGSFHPHGSLADNRQLLVSLIIFAVVFVLSVIPKKHLRFSTHNLQFLSSPITLILLAALAGLLVY